MFNDLIHFISNNQILTLLFGGSVTASLLYALKGIPKQIWGFFTWKFTSSLLIPNDDGGYTLISNWLCEQEFMQKTRHLTADAQYMEHECSTDIKLAPGFGTNWFKFNGKYILVKRSVSSNLNKYGKSTEYITLSVFGKPIVLRELVNKVLATYNGKETFVEIYTYSGYWMKTCRKEKRSLESVVLPIAQKNKILVDIDKFLNSREWYRERGIPYRRGVMLSGPPGTGKTSFVLALAGHFSMRIYAINLASLSNDKELLSAITQVPEKSILLLEDIDAVQADRDPENKDEDEKAQTKVSLSGLLNAVDGVFSRDGRILIMTTNHIQKLDKALIRPGRVDLIEEFLPLQEAECLTMCKQFLGEDGCEFAKNVMLPITAAELQKQLIQKVQCAS